MQGGVAALRGAIEREGGKQADPVVKVMQPPTIGERLSGHKRSLIPKKTVP